MSEPDLTNVTPSCGTYAGYQRHRRRREEPCQFCRDANAEYGKRYRRRNPEKRDAERRLVAAQSRAAWRLTHDHPEQFRAYVAEEMSKG